jgi:hypothetical protein
LARCSPSVCQHVCRARELRLFIMLREVVRAQPPIARLCLLSVAVYAWPFLRGLPFSVVYYLPPPHLRSYVRWTRCVPVLARLRAGAPLPPT